jgi:DNA phosphorothioation-dependent restriction protein DptG
MAPYYPPTRGEDGKLSRKWLYSFSDDHSEEFVDNDWYNEKTENWVDGATPKDMGGKLITFV